MKKTSGSDRNENSKDDHILNALKLTYSLTEPILKTQFLQFYKIPSTKVRRCIEIEFQLLTRADLEKQKTAIMQLMATFEDQDCIDYLLTYKKWFEFKYRLYPEKLRLARLHELSEISLRQPLYLTKPISYIEFSVLANTFPNIHQVTKDIPLEDLITALVQQYGIKPDKKKVDKLLKAEKKEGKSTPKGQRTLSQFY